jgi:hypothetical protein
MSRDSCDSQAISASATGVAVVDGWCDAVTDGWCDAVVDGWCDAVTDGSGAYGASADTLDGRDLHPVAPVR